MGNASKSFLPKTQARHTSFVVIKRLVKLVGFLATAPRGRPEILKALGLELRTFYRDMGLLDLFGIKVVYEGKRYSLKTPRRTAVGSLPLPDVRLSLAEAYELASGPSLTAARLAMALAELGCFPPPQPLEGQDAPEAKE